MRLRGAGSPSPGPRACRSLSPTFEDAWAQLASPDWNFLGTSFGESEVTAIFFPLIYDAVCFRGGLQSTPVTRCKLHLLHKTQFYIRGITCWTEKCPKRSLIVNWLSILFFKVVIFVLVVTASAVPFLYNYAISSHGRSRGQSLPTAQHPC